MHKHVQTVIVDNVSKLGGGGQAISIETELGKPFRLTGLTLRGMAQDTQVYNHGTVALFGTSREVRLDHLAFEKPGTAAIRFSGAIWGVVDHSHFDLSNFKQGLIIWHAAWGGRDYGDGSFAAAAPLGTDQAIFVEDNTFIESGVAGAALSTSPGFRQPRAARVPAHLDPAIAAADTHGISTTWLAIPTADSRPRSFWRLSARAGRPQSEQPA